MAKVEFVLLTRKKTRRIPSSGYCGPKHSYGEEDLACRFLESGAVCVFCAFCSDNVGVSVKVGVRFTYFPWSKKCLDRGHVHADGRIHLRMPLRCSRAMCMHRPTDMIQTSTEVRCRCVDGQRVLKNSMEIAPEWMKKTL